MLEQLTTIISDIIVQFSYWGIFAITFIENIIAPIPSEFVFPWAGFLAYQGLLNIWLIALSGALGSLAAALVLYYLGARFNGPKTREFVNKYGKYIFVSYEDLERSEQWFNKYGIWTVFLFRMVPLGRTVVSIPAGFIKMNIVTFSLLTFAGTFIWCLLLSYAGYLLGENWGSVEQFSDRYQKLIIILILLSGIAFLYFRRERVTELLKEFTGKSAVDKTTDAS